MTDKLLDALRKKFASPERAVATLGLDAALLPVASRYVLAQDQDSVVERSTGRKFDKVTFMKRLFEKENPMVQSRLARLAHDQADLPSKAGLAGQPKPNLDQDDPTTGGAAPSAAMCWSNPVTNRSVMP